MGHAAHGQDPHAHAVDPHGSEIPAAPARRNITPAPQDFVGLPGPSGFLWPVLWVAVAAFAVAALLCGGWHVAHEEHAHQSHPSAH